MKAALVGALVLLALSVGVASASSTAMHTCRARTAGHSRCRSGAADVAGIVMRGPTTPICVAGAPCEGPAAGVTVKAFAAQRLVAETSTGGNGRFRFSLASGYYTIVVLDRGVAPRTVHVTATRLLRLSFLVDTGIR